VAGRRRRGSGRTHRACRLTRLQDQLVQGGILKRFNT
jgi:hypothetical protein